MAIQTYNLTPARIDRFKGQILKHAIPMECLGSSGRQVQFDKNSSMTYVARRYLPYGSTATNANTQNQFFANGTGDRGNAMVAAHLMAEGVTPAPDSIAAVDITEVIQEYSCLYGWTNRTANYYEDDIPAEYIKQIGERVTLVNEMIVYGKIKTCTNQYFGGSGVSRSTVNGKINLPILRNVARNLKANHAMMPNSMLAPKNEFGTTAVAAGFNIYVNTDLDGDIRDLPNFKEVETYGGKMPGEIGKCENFRFIGHPDLVALQDSGALVGSTQLYSTSLVNIDVYPCIVEAKDAWSQIAVRGISALKPTILPAGHPSPTDPHGQRGYAGTMWSKAVMLENQGWMAVVNVGRSNA